MSNWNVEDVVEFFKLHHIHDQFVLKYLYFNKVDGKIMDECIDKIICDLGIDRYKCDSKMIVDKWKQISVKNLSPNFFMKSIWKSFETDSVCFKLFFYMNLFTVYCIFCSIGIHYSAMKKKIAY
jgi:hypothetical protein